MSTHTGLRSRAPVGLGGTFFRTKHAGQDNLSIAMTLSSGTYTLTVRDTGSVVETFTHSGQGTPEGDPLACTPNLIGNFRADVNTNSNYIEMPTIDYGGESACSSPVPIFTSGTDDAGCLSAFAETNFSGGEGIPSEEPAPPAPETSPRTGPERTLFGVTLTEIITNTAADDGQLYDPPPTEKVFQWDGTDWISYEPGVCV